MTKLSYKEAAVRLEVSTQLLKWFSKYAPRCDGRKLAIDPDGLVELTELSSFDDHLWDDWGDRNVPSGVRRELDCEVRGTCPCCQNPCDTFQAAHIGRKGQELPHYTQHPHNLINLCPACHARYDAKGGSLTHEVIQSTKRSLRARHLEAIKLDVERAEAFRTVAEEIKADIRAQLAATNASPGVIALEWTKSAHKLHEAASTLGGQFLTAPTNVIDLKRELMEFSASNELHFPTLSGVVEDVANQVNTLPAQGVDNSWLLIGTPDDECTRCGAQPLIDSIECVGCGEGSYDASDADSYELDRVDDGVAISLENARGDVDAVECRKCGGTSFEVWFESLCGYCKHLTEKVANE